MCYNKDFITIYAAKGFLETSKPYSLYVFLFALILFTISQNYLTSSLISSKSIPTGLPLRVLPTFISIRLYRIFVNISYVWHIIMSSKILTLASRQKKNPGCSRFLCQQRSQYESSQNQIQSGSIFRPHATDRPTHAVLLSTGNTQTTCSAYKHNRLGQRRTHTAH